MAGVNQPIFVSWYPNVYPAPKSDANPRAEIWLNLLICLNF